MEAATTMQCRDWTRGAGTAHEHCPSLPTLLFPASTDVARVLLLRPAV